MSIISSATFLRFLDSSLVSPSALVNETERASGSTPAV
jgi:hypothetical protein